MEMDDTIIEYEEEIVTMEEGMELDETYEEIQKYQDQLALNNRELGFLELEENELQDQFVNGIISFTEYSSRLEAALEKHIHEEDEEEIQNEEDKDIDVDSSKNIARIDLDTFQQMIKVNEKINKEKKEIQKKDKIKDKTTRVRIKLPMPLKGLLGQATMKFLRKEDRQQAIDMVLEVVRQCPKSAEPYNVLTSMYDEMGDKENAFKMLMISAHLSSNASDWIKIAQQFEKADDIRQAISCYSKALKADVTRIDIHDRRAQLCKQIDMKQNKFILAGYLRYLKNVDETSDKSSILQISKRTAKFYHECNDYKSAVEALSRAFKFCANVIQPEDVNLYLELLLVLKHYHTCLKVLHRFCYVRVQYQIDSSSSSNLLRNENDELLMPCPPSQIRIVSCDLDHASIILAPDILTKLFIVLIHLNCTTYFPAILKQLMTFDLSLYGDLYLDVSDSFMKQNFFQQSIDILKKLVANEKYNLPGVWKQLAQCYEHLGAMEDCKISYLKVIEKAPLFIDIRRHLSEIFLRENNVDRAVDMFNQEIYINDLFNAQLQYSNIAHLQPLLSGQIIIEQLQLMMKYPRDDIEYNRKFVQSFIVFLTSNSIVPINLHEVKAILTRSKVSKKIEAVNYLRGIKDKISPVDNRDMFVEEPPPSREVLFSLFKYAMELCMNENSFSTDMYRIVILGFGNAILLPASDTASMDEMSMLAIIGLYLHNKADFAYILLSFMFYKLHDCKVLFNIMNQIFTRCYDGKYIRNTLRSFQTKPNHIGLNMLYANNCLLTSNFKYAVNEYYLISQHFDHKNPLYLLLLASSYSQIAMQKFMDKKPHLLVHALAFLKEYQKHRGENLLQEIYYNFGRMYHQAALFTNAILYYKKALNQKCVSPKYDLTYEIAFNLHSVYYKCQSYTLAKYIMYKYLVI